MKLSVITVNLNQAAGLKSTIESVVCQSFRDYEFIIIDGGSTDGSVAVIKAYEQELAYWVSEPDHGVFHAMNKGVERATGEYLLMLNAGDVLCDALVLERVFRRGAYLEDLLFGDVYRAVDGTIFDRSIFPDKLTFNFFRNGSISHQGTFIKRSVHQLLGLYDEGLKYTADWKLFTLAVCKYCVSYRHLPFFVSVCDCSGLTCNPMNFSAMSRENNEMMKRHFPAFLDDYKHYDRILEIKPGHNLRGWPGLKLTVKKLLHKYVARH